MNYMSSGVMKWHQGKSLKGGWEQGTLSKHANYTLIWIKGSLAMDEFLSYGDTMGIFKQQMVSEKRTFRKHIHISIINHVQDNAAHVLKQNFFTKRAFRLLCWGWEHSNTARTAVDATCWAKTTESNVGGQTSYQCLN